MGVPPIPDITLGASEQDALRSLLAVEGRLAGQRQRRSLLEDVSRLIRCDAVGVGTGDHTGLVLDGISLPGDHLDWVSPQACDGPFPLGLQHWSRDPVHRDDLARYGLRDTISVSFRSGQRHVVQLWLDRWERPFDDRDAALLGLVGPILERLLRDHPVATVPVSLTVAERRVLQLVATGLGNSAIAERLFISPSTVRKHLEHSYRKLGVTNRVAAVRQFEGWLVDEEDWVERISRAEETA